MQRYYAAVNVLRTSAELAMATPAAQGAKRGLRVVFAPVIAVGGAYSAMAAQAPFTTGFVTTGIKTTAADAFAQLVVEKKEKMDWRRNAMFTAFGFCYLGGFQYWLYNVKFTQWCGFITKHSGHLGSAPVKTFIDQILHHPSMYFPCFYSLKAAVEGRPILSGEDSAMKRYSEEYWDCWKACWSIWIPAQIVNFTFTPRHLRIPFVAATSFVWTVTLSLMQGSFSEGKTEGVKQKQLANAPASGAAASGGASGGASGTPDTVAMQATLVVPKAADRAYGQKGQSVAAASVVEEEGDNKNATSPASRAA